MGENGLLLIGERGILFSDWRRWRLFPDKLAKEYGEPPKTLSRSLGHHQEFITACTKAGRQPDQILIGLGR